MKFLNRFRSKKRQPNVEVPAEIQEAMRTKLQEVMNAKATGCPYRFLTEPAHFCNKSLLKGSDSCFWHTPNTTKYDAKVMQEYFGDSRSLKEAMEREVAESHSLSGAYLSHAAIEGNWFQRGANLPGADLRFADLSYAHLSYGSLKGANLAGANLESTFLSDVDMRDANFTHANLFNAKFRQNNFAGVRGLTKECFLGWKWGFVPVYRILEEYPDDAEDAYRSMVTYFSNKGLLDDASWAAYRSRIAHRQFLKKSLGPMHTIIEAYVESSLFQRGSSPERLTRLAALRSVSRGLNLILSYVACYAFGYGEKPVRVSLFAAFMVVVYAVLFTWLKVLPEQGFGPALYFSIVTFTTLGYGDLTPRREFRLLAASEAVIGVVLVGLFLFTLSRRAVGRG